ncbi:MAG: PaaI family thioesterase [Acidimicrobiales bacterium]|nr:PaaI family thioesterase [Acidimicrobiales bacterium]
MIRPTFDTFNQEWADKVIGRVSRSGIDSYLGLKVTGVEPGRLVCEMPVTEELITNMGNMHGGCLSALCDHALGLVMYPVMPVGYWAATTEFKTNLLAPVTGGTCVATAEIISMSKRMAVIRIDIENEGRLVMAAQGTCTIVAPKK